MVKITKVYTKTGDAGKTSLTVGKAIGKESTHVEVIGNLDELNSFLGFATESLSSIKILLNLQKKLIRIQNELFDLGSQIAVLPENRRTDTPGITEQDVTTLEAEIDAMNRELPTLRSFILPGGGENASRLHLARTVCRRTERSLVTLNLEKKYLALEIKYLNRLSDWLFVAARFSAHKLGIKEQLWEPGRREY